MRQRHWPNTMLATSTHDNKRSEDVRHRIDVLSEQPAALRLGLRHWKAAVDRARPMLDGERVPSHSDLYLLYQTLVGSWPFEFAQGGLLFCVIRLGPGERAGGALLIRRVIRSQLPAATIAQWQS